MRPLLRIGNGAPSGAPAGAARRLAGQVGAYCRFCEMPLGVDLALPPPEAGEDDGGIACAACRAALGRAAGDPALADAAGALLRPETTVNADGEVAVAGDPVHQLVAFALDGRSQVALADAGLLHLSEAERGEGWALTTWRDRLLWVVPDEAYLATRGAEADALRERVLATLRVLGLNRHRPDDPRAEDRRVVGRTYVHDRAVAALRGLTRTVDSLPADGDGGPLAAPAVALLEAGIREAARALGFWSVWMRVFRDGMDDPGIPAWRRTDPEARAALLRRLFVRQPLAAAAGASAPERDVFPGTDHARLA